MAERRARMKAFKALSQSQSPSQSQSQGRESRKSVGKSVESPVKTLGDDKDSPQFYFLSEEEVASSAGGKT